MRKIREILRLKWVAMRSHREPARSLGVSPGTVGLAVSGSGRREGEVLAVELFVAVLGASNYTLRRGVQRTYPEWAQH